MNTYQYTCAPDTSYQTMELIQKQSHGPGITATRN